MGIAAGDGAAFAASGSHTLAADSVNRVVIRDDGASLTVSAPTQIARGLRNAAGMVFDGLDNLWLQDNGIDTEGNRGVSFSADELNRVNASDLGTSVSNFGFADTYVRYSDGQAVGPTAGVTPLLAAFLPIDGRKSEGAVETGNRFHFIESGVMGRPGAGALDLGHGRRRPRLRRLRDRPTHADPAGVILWTPRIHRPNGS